MLHPLQVPHIVLVLMVAIVGRTYMQTTYVVKCNRYKYHALHMRYEFRLSPTVYIFVHIIKNDTIIIMFKLMVWWKEEKKWLGKGKR